MDCCTTALLQQSAIARPADPCSPRPSPMQIASEGLKGRVFECNLADLQSVSVHLPAVPSVTAFEVPTMMAMLTHGSMSLQNEADAYRKIRLRAEDVQGRNVLTNFWVSMGHNHRPVAGFGAAGSALVP